MFSAYMMLIISLAIGLVVGIITFILARKSRDRGIITIGAAAFSLIASIVIIAAPLTVGFPGSSAFVDEEGKLVELHQGSSGVYFWNWHDVARRIENEEVFRLWVGQGTVFYNVYPLIFDGKLITFNVSYEVFQDEGSLRKNLRATNFGELPLYQVVEAAIYRFSLEAPYPFTQQDLDDFLERRLIEAGLKLVSASWY